MGQGRGLHCEGEDVNKEKTASLEGVAVLLQRIFEGRVRTVLAGARKEG